MTIRGGECPPRYFALLHFEKTCAFFKRRDVFIEEK
jgi:hypothetical protein